MAIRDRNTSQVDFFFSTSTTLELDLFNSVVSPNETRIQFLFHSHSVVDLSRFSSEVDVVLGEVVYGTSFNGTIISQVFYRRSG